jgi:hypothetical protein
VNQPGQAGLLPFPGAILYLLKSMGKVQSNINPAVEILSLLIAQPI